MERLVHPDTISKWLCDGPYRAKDRVELDAARTHCDGGLVSLRYVLPSPHPALSLVLWSLDDSPYSGIAPAELAPDERDRMARFVFDRDRDRYAAGRAGLRRELGARIGEPPSALSFDYGLQGRPTLRGIADVDFNLSHTGGLALLAILDCRAQPGRVGIDVESRRNRLGELLPRPHLEDLGRVCFSPTERAALERATAPHDVFYRTWTRKEAVIKALGDGIAYGLERFDVSDGPDARLLRFDDPHEDASTWSLWDLGLVLPPWAGDVAAAVAIRKAPDSRKVQQ